MEITAYYKINGAESNGFGLKHHLDYDEKKTFQVNDKIEAFFEAIYQARLIAEDALSSPATGKTIVTLVELCASSKKILFEGRKNYVSCSTAEHLFNCHFTRKEYYDLMGFTEEIKKIKEELREKQKKKRKFMRLENFL
ncbi:MAG: hypothetical protein PHG04_02575 [Candidatus Nanoarchaeia archaeon]|nr:hypothetical protein [Candidatus Nanoarchaeia archaeon]